MKFPRALFIFSTFALTTGIGTAANAADDIALSFNLDAAEDTKPSEDKASASEQSGTSSSSVAANVEGAQGDQAAPLPIPPAAEQPPFADSEATLQESGGSQAMTLGSDRTLQSPTLPAPPPRKLTSSSNGNRPISQLTAQVSQALNQSQAIASTAIAQNTIDKRDIGLDFDPSIPEAASLNRAKPWTPAVDLAGTISDIFSGGVGSLVARAVGSAEGTRTPEGHRTPAYFGHVDPGNGVWNLGTFSYQHRAKTPEEADARQLDRLKSQSLTLKQKAEANNLTLSLEELLNGIDLANQAPAAALEREGYIEWLAEAHKLGMNGSEAIVWARTRSFIDPNTQRWNAPGLGNNVHSISQDQSRRVQAIAKAVSTGAVAHTLSDIYPQTQQTSDADSLQAQPPSSNKNNEAQANTQTADSPEAIDVFLQGSVDSSATLLHSANQTQASDAQATDTRNANAKKPASSLLTHEANLPQTLEPQALALASARALSASATPDPSTANVLHFEPVKKSTTQKRTNPKSMPNSAPASERSLSDLEPFPQPNIDPPDRSNITADNAAKTNHADATPMAPYVVIPATQEVMP